MLTELWVDRLGFRLTFNENTSMQIWPNVNWPNFSYHFYHTKAWNNVHLISATGIRMRNLLYMSLQIDH